MHTKRELQPYGASSSQCLSVPRGSETLAIQICHNLERLALAEEQANEQRAIIIAVEEEAAETRLRVAVATETLATSIVEMRQCTEGWREYLKARAVYLLLIATLLYANLDDKTQASLLATFRLFKQL